jgi:uncharacterized protein YndB with AHSA1/START domain
MATEKFVYVSYIRTTPEKLWEALISPEFTRRYWFGSWQESEWQCGSAWRLMAPDGTVTDAGEVVEIDPPRRLVLSWRNEFMEAARAEGVTHATFELEPSGETVKLTVIHEMPVRGVMLEGVSEGWPHILSSLKTLLETGHALPGTDQWPWGRTGE